MSNIKKSLYRPNIWDIENINNIIKYCKDIIKKEKETEKPCNAFSFMYYNKKGDYLILGGFNMIGNCVKLKDYVHPLVRFLIRNKLISDEKKGKCFICDRANIDYLDTDFFTNREWVTRRGFIILTQFCVDYIISENSDINSIDDIDLILHTNFVKYGEIYLSEVTIYEEGTDDIILEDDPEEEIEEEKKSFLKILKEKMDVKVKQNVYKRN